MEEARVRRRDPGPRPWRATGLPRAPRPPQGRVTWLSRPERGVRFVHLFAVKEASLSSGLKSLRREIAPEGVVWVSWPKMASGVETDVTEDAIRQVALPMGFVDVKVCAVDEVWSGLKLMIRRTER